MIKWLKILSSFRETRTTAGITKARSVRSSRRRMRGRLMWKDAWHCSPLQNFLWPYSIYIYTIDICVLIFIAWHNITRYQQISPVSWANPNSIFGDIPTKLGSLCPDGYYPLLPGQSWTAHLRIAKTRVFHYWNTVLIPWWLELLLKFWSLDWYESCMGFIDAWEPAMNPKTHKTLCIEMTTWK